MDLTWPRECKSHVIESYFIGSYVVESYITDFSKLTSCRNVLSLTNSFNFSSWDNFVGHSSPGVYYLLF
jgi:hypothetical protein